MKEDLNHRQQQARPYTHVEFSRIVRSEPGERSQFTAKRDTTDRERLRFHVGEERRKKKIRKFG